LLLFLHNFSINISQFLFINICYGIFIACKVTDYLNSVDFLSWTFERPTLYRTSYALIFASSWLIIYFHINSWIVIRVQIIYDLSASSKFGVFWELLTICWSCTLIFVMVFHKHSLINTFSIKFLRLQIFAVLASFHGPYSNSLFPQIRTHSTQFTIVWHFSNRIFTMKQQVIHITLKWHSFRSVNLYFLFKDLVYSNNPYLFFFKLIIFQNYFYQLFL